MDGTVGELRFFAASFAPRSWALCLGQIVAVQSNTALYSILGTTYGGNGTSTFALPNMAGRTPVGTGASPGTSTYVLGQQAGTPNVTLLIPNLPMHNHTATATYSGGSATVRINVVDNSNSLDAAGNYIGAEQNNSYFTNGNVPLVPMATGALSVSLPTAPQINTVTLGVTGGTTAHNNMQPYLALTCLICQSGTFPARN